MLTFLTFLTFLFLDRRLNPRQRRTVHSHVSLAFPDHYATLAIMQDARVFLAVIRHVESDSVGACVGL
jgi:hypothetical protein